uniref:C2H2-type domain-containing protein n=1 Tax=Octopus bimaculoides TaxID=37653 RepID=A0A0L8GAL3_OCTBM
MMMMMMIIIIIIIIIITTTTTTTTTIIIIIIITTLLFGELQKGKRPQGGQKRFKDTLKALLKAFNIDHDTWEITAAEGCRQDRKNRTKNPVAGATIPCPHCQRLFRAQIGLTSHLRTHKTSPAPPQDD